MKKTLISLIAIVLLITLVAMPINVKADSEYPPEVRFGSGEGVELSSVKGASYDKTSNVLTLSNVNYTENELFASMVGDSFTIKVEGTNTISGILVSDGSITITGEGTLNITGKTPINVEGKKLVVDEKVTVKMTSTNGTLIQMSENNSVTLKNGQSVSLQKVKLGSYPKYISGKIGDDIGTYPVYADKSGNSYGVDSFSKKVYNISEKAAGKNDWGEDYYNFTENTTVNIDDLTEVNVDYFSYQVNGTALTIEPKTEENKEEENKQEENKEEENKQEENKKEENKEEAKEPTVVAEEGADEEDVAAAKEVGSLVDEILAGKEVEGIDAETATTVVAAKAAGKEVKVDFSSKEVKKEEVAEDVEKAEQKLAANEKIAGIFDVSINLKAGNDQLGKVTKLNKKVAFKLPIPEELRTVPAGYERIFSLLNIHGGVTNRIDVESDGENVSGESDEYSTYVLTYTDKKITSNPETGDAISLFVGMFAISTVGAIAVFRKIK